MPTLIERRSDSEKTVVTIVKTPLLRRPTTVRLPASLDVETAIEMISQAEASDDEDRRVRAQLAREMAEPHLVLAADADGRFAIVPKSTKLSQLAVPREIATREGKREMTLVVPLEVQAYAAVGA